MVASHNETIEVSFGTTFYIGNKEKKDVWGKLIGISQQFIEPQIVEKLVRRIFADGETIKIGGVEFTKDGYSRSKMFGGRETVSWNDTIFIPKFASGSVTLWKNKNGKSASFETIPMKTPNAVVLPELVQACYSVATGNAKIRRTISMSILISSTKPSRMSWQRSRRPPATRSTWRNVAIVVTAVVALIGWLALSSSSSENSAPSSYTPPTANRKAATSQPSVANTPGTVANGEFSCSSEDSRQADLLSPTNDLELTSEEEALKRRMTQLDTLKAQDRGNRRIVRSVECRPSRRDGRPTQFAACLVEERSCVASGTHRHL